MKERPGTKEGREPNEATLEITRKLAIVLAFLSVFYFFIKLLFL
jgi:hypothetical protein